MSYLGNTSDLESEKMDFGRNRKTNIVSKLQAHKISSEPKWSNKHEDDSDSESTNENFLTKGAFLLTPSYELSMERAALICEKMSFKGCFSLTKTASGILFKFSHPDDYQAVYKKGFHKVTGARFYRKERIQYIQIVGPLPICIYFFMGIMEFIQWESNRICKPWELDSNFINGKQKIAIPCRPRKTFTLYVLDVPEDLPVEDIRHALYKFDSVVEVVRLHRYQQPTTINFSEKTAEASSTPKSEGTDKVERPEKKELPQAVIRVTLASLDEYNILLQNGLNFYDATFFPTETNISLKGAKIEYKRRMLDGSIPGRVRELLPVFDAAGFCKLTPPVSKLIKPPRS